MANKFFRAHTVFTLKYLFRSYLGFISFAAYRGQYNRIMTSERYMSLILCGDPKQDQQENSLLNIILIYCGMQLINMTSTKLQNKHRERPSFPIKMIHVMILNMILKMKILHLIKIKMSLPHTQSFNSPSIRLHLKNLPNFYSLSTLEKVP